jgi:quinol monooxygenase YgiN
MFGTIGHAQLKPGQRDQLEALMTEWRQTIRPQVPGPFVQYVGHQDGQPNGLVFVALAQDKATYQRLAALPAQDAWYRRLRALLDGDVRWDDVELEAVPD